MIDATHLIFIVAATLIVTVGAIRVSVATGTPSMLVYLAIGVLLGQTVIRNYESHSSVYDIGTIALALILAEGGLTTRWRDVRRVIAPASALATLGTGISIVVVGLAGRYVLQLPWEQSLLIGAVVSSTDAAAVFSVLRSVNVPQRVSSMLEAESGFNDAPVVLLALTLTEVISADSGASWPYLMVLMAVELIGGSALGLGIGWVVAQRLRHIALPAAGLYPIAVLSGCLVAYSAATLLGMSGFIACYLCALLLGNSRLPHQTAVRGFAEGVGWLAQIGMFVVLGLVVRPDHLVDQIIPALLIGLVLLFVARPASVIASCLPFRFSWREQAVLSWAGLRGAVPIVLATIPVTGKIPYLENLYELVFILVVVFVLVQAPTLPILARKLGLVTPVSQPLDIEAAPLGDLDADLVTVSIGPGSRLAGVSVAELRLPTQAKVALVVRDKVSSVPTPDSLLRIGDRLLILTTRDAYGDTARRLVAVSEAGRLARWRPKPGKPGESAREATVKTTSGMQTTSRGRVRPPTPRDPEAR